MLFFGANVAKKFITNEHFTMKKQNLTRGKSRAGGQSSATFRHAPLYGIPGYLPHGGTPVGMTGTPIT